MLAHRARICARGWPATRVAELGVGPDVQCQRICRWQVRTTCSVGTGFVFGGGACHCVNCGKEEAVLLPEKDLRPGQSASRILIKTEKNCKTCWQRCCMTLSQPYVLVQAAQLKARAKVRAKYHTLAHFRSHLLELCPTRGASC